jgi:hypothetical protein
MLIVMASWLIGSMTYIYGSVPSVENESPLAPMKLPLSATPLSSFRQLPLRWVLIIPFVLQTVGLATLVGYLTHQNGQRSVNELVQNLQEEVEARICDRLDGYLAVPPQLNQINADAYELGRLDVSDFKTTGQYFWRQLQVFNVSFINFANAKGEYVGVGDFGDGKLRIEDIPIHTKGKSYQYSTDAKGKRVQLFSVQDYNPFEEAWFTNALKAKKPIWSDIYNWDGFPKIMSISASYPVYTQGGKLVGVFGVDLKLSNISDFLSQLKIGKSGKAFVLERSGLLVASSVQEPPYMMVQGVAQRLPARQSKDADIRLTTKALQSEVGSFKTLQGDHRLTLDIEGQKKYIQASPWRDKLGLDWLVVMVVPESDFMAQVHTNTLRTTLLSLGALLLSIILGILTARWIARPVLRLSQASQVFAQAAQRGVMGGFLEPSPVTSSIQELETLSQSFYQMGAQLQMTFSKLESANQELENQVTQRTQELEQANTEIAQLNTQLETEDV